MSSKEMYGLYVEILRETEEALFIFDGTERVWLPKSQVKYSELNKNGEAMILVPEWLAVKKGLI
jgi:hypothetical protein